MKPLHIRLAQMLARADKAGRLPTREDAESAGVKVSVRPIQLDREQPEQYPSSDTDS